LEDEAFGQAASQFFDGFFLVIGVVTFGFPGQQDVQGIVAIVVPLGIEALLQQRGLVVLVLQHQPHMPARFHRRAHALRQFHQEVGLVDGVHRVQAQAIAAVIAQPHQGVLDEVLAHLWAAEIDGVAPGRLAVFPEERAGVLVQVVAVRAEVVVDHIDHHHQPVAMGLIDQRAQLLRAAIAVLRRIGQYTVVAPVTVTGELPQGHQLDGADAQFGQPRQPSGDPLVALEHADVQFLDHRFVPGPALPGVLPVEGADIHDLARPVHPFGLVARRRVRHLQLAVDTIVITVTGPARGNPGVPAAVFGQQLDRGLLFQFQAHAARIGRPQGEARRRGVHQVCAMSVHLLTPLSSGSGGPA